MIPSPGRLGFFALGVVSLATVLNQIIGSLTSEGIWGGIEEHLTPFTHWTNTLIAVVALGAGLIKDWTHRWIALVSGAALYGVFVALIYHTVLTEGARLLAPVDWDDALQHTLAPGALAALWVMAVPHGRLTLRDALLWPVFPLAYLAFALLRGALRGDYPYFFLNLQEIGALAVAAWVAGISVFFLGLGAALVSLDRRLA